MKKILLQCIVMISLVMTPFSSVFAYDVLEQPCASGSSSAFCQNVQQQKSEDRIVGPNGIITRITKIVIFFTGAASIIIMIVGGIKYILANGDSNAVGGAKKTIFYALIGLAVAILSQAIVTLVLARL